MHMKLKKNIATSEAGFVFNPGTGDSFSVNSLGAEIIASFRENMSADDIIGILSLKYDVERSQLERDMEDFVSQLYSYSLLEK
jgi:hypothetical protein